MYDQVYFSYDSYFTHSHTGGDTLILLGDEAQGIAIVKQEMLVKFAEAI